MASGCPTLVSNTSSLPEICQDVSIYCKPNDIEDISRKIILLLSSDNKEVIKKGREQAKKFSWLKCAQETLNIYKHN
jgi:glycosyltransferase involved in cell wall biosynthesis